MEIGKGVFIRHVLNKVEEAVVSFKEEGQRVGYEVKIVRWMEWNTEAGRYARDNRGEA